MANTNNKRGPYMPNLEAFHQLGVDPKTGLPVKQDNQDGKLKDEIKKILRVVDEQDSIGRFEWQGLPPEIDPELLERILFYRGQAMLFYMEDLDQYFFLPYALDGTIDVYGRFRGVTPVPFMGSTDPDGKEKPWVVGLTRTPLYQPFDAEKMGDINSARNNYCVILKDYTEQLPQKIISRQILDESVLDVMANCIPYMNTALVRSTGVGAIRVGSSDEQSNITAANRAMKHAALAGEPYIPIVGTIEWQNLNDGPTAKAEEFMQAFQSLDNFRLSTKGLDNGGVFEKKAHKLEAEQEQANTQCSLVMNDGLRNRQKWAEIVNSLFGWSVSVKVRETSNDKGLSSGADTGDVNTTINDDGGKENG